MTGPEEDHLGSVGRLGPHPVELSRQLGLGGPEVEAGEGRQRLAEFRGVGGNERRQLVEDPLDLGLGRELRFPPGIAELDGNERLDEERLAAAGRVVDDALDLRAGLRLDWHHVAAVAERDDRVL